MEVTQAFHMNKEDGETSYEKKLKPILQALFYVNFHYLLAFS